MVKDKRFIMKSSIIILTSLIIIFLTAFYLKDDQLYIKEEELELILEFDQVKQNEETDRFIETVIEEYFANQGKTITIKEISYDLRNVSQGDVIKSKEVTGVQDPIKRWIKENNKKDDQGYHVEIINLDPEDYFIGQALSDQEHEITFQYRVFNTDFPKIHSEKQYELKLNSKESFLKMISASDRTEEDLQVEIVQDIPWDQEGTYELELKAINKHGNESKQTVTIILIDETKNQEEEKIESQNKLSNNTIEKPKPTPPTTEQKTQTTIKDETLETNDTIIAEYKPMPTAPPNPNEDNTWKKHPKDFIGHDGVKMYFHKNYGNFETCHATMDDLLDEKAWEADWDSAFCNDNGDLYYSIYN